jgi:hypothetical protein
MRKPAPTMQESKALLAELHALRENLEKERQLRKEEQRLRKETEEREEMKVKELRSQLEKERSKNTAVDPVYLHFVDSSEIGPESYKAVLCYEELAERILNDHDARTFIQALVDELMNGTEQHVFNALCVPWGTGKTQLAFSLPKDRYECLYLNMDVLSSQSPERQSVYNAFAGYMGPFMLSTGDEYFKTQACIIYKKYGLSSILMGWNRAGRLLRYYQQRLWDSEHPSRKLNMFELAYYQNLLQAIEPIEMLLNKLADEYAARYWRITIQYYCRICNAIILFPLLYLSQVLHRHKTAFFRTLTVSNQNARK